MEAALVLYRWSRKLGYLSQARRFIQEVAPWMFLTGQLFLVQSVFPFMTVRRLSRSMSKRICGNLG